MNLNRILKNYDYKFPDSLIAQEPAHPRDSARLLIYENGSKRITHSIFTDLPDALTPGSVLVLNQTKVIPARLKLTKPTGGSARLLYIKHDSKFVYALSDRKLEIGSIVKAAPKIGFEVTGKEGSHYLLKPHFPINQVISVLEKFGTTPLPPYIKHPTLKGKKLADEYNTVFAKVQGSVAAPTASLHFTKRLLQKIQKSGIAIQHVTLHVNLGTFAPLTEEQVKTGQLHSEHFEISPSTAKFLNKAKKDGRTIIAAGTTVVRTLESASNAKGQLTKLSGDTTLFINEKTNLNFVDELITNFHVPRSSLLMLVSAFTGRQDLLRIYQTAVNKKYRLFSFGDGMYIKK